MRALTKELLNSLSPPVPEEVRILMKIRSESITARDKIRKTRKDLGKEYQDKELCSQQRDFLREYTAWLDEEEKWHNEQLKGAEDMLEWEVYIGAV